MRHNPSDIHHQHDRSILNNHRRKTYADLLAIHEERKRKESMSYRRSLMTPALRFAVMKRDHYRCRLCGKTADQGAWLEVDHITPVSKGGKTVLDNLWTLCFECNRGKGAERL